MAMSMKDLEEKIGAIVGKGVKDGITNLEARMEELEKVPKTEVQTKEAPTDAIHTKGNIVDDGYIQDVGRNEFRLKGGSIVCADSLWQSVGKGFHRRPGAFLKLGEEAEEFFVKMKEGLNRSQSFKAKALDISDVTRAADDSSAGLFVPDDVRYALLQFAPPGTIVWPRAQVWPMISDNIQWPKLVQTIPADAGEEGSFFGNVTLEWTEEGGSKTNTKPEFTNLTLACHELSAYTEVTDILLEDSAINIGNLLVQLFQGAYWHLTDRVFFHGYGATRPLGILVDPNVNEVDRVTSGAVRYEDCLNMSTALPSMFDANAVWMMSKEVFNDLRKQKDDNGRPVIDLGYGYNDFGEGVAGYLAGYPIVMSDYKTASLGSRGDIVLGNWKHYFIGERKSLAIDMSRHYPFRENRTAFRATGRLGGIAEEPQAFVVLTADADPNMS
jgi:HK97 family phage major capsid protein